MLRCFCPFINDRDLCLIARLDDLNVQAQPSVPETNTTYSTEDPFKRPFAPPLKKKEKGKRIWFIILLLLNQVRLGEN